MTKLLVGALLGAFIFSSVANATEELKELKTPSKKSKIEPIRIVPKQDRGIASEEDDGFIPLMTPNFKKQKRTPAAKCAGASCKTNKKNKKS